MCNKNHKWRCQGIWTVDSLCWMKMRSQAALTVNTKLGTDHGHLLFANSTRSLPYFSSHRTHCFYAYCILPTSYYLRIAYALPTYCLCIAYERIAHCLHVETGKRQQAGAPQQTVPYLAIRIFRGDQYSRPHFSRAVLITIIITAYYECTHSERKF